ncbi:hypothetical protein G5I_09400 [Acromyrmex echinatior]|uniref:Uncharacterized protein n=1 Tax=Acromyrmex echinatior TaxID=103372 RepID=F4WU45_ACREC|nr:hypothetical protein G5I_09400 [Acromyrmex echinatior]
MKWQPAQVYVYLIERVSQPTKKEKEGGRENVVPREPMEEDRETERGRMRTTNKGREPKSRRNYDVEASGNVDNRTRRLKATLSGPEGPDSVKVIAREDVSSITIFSSYEDTTIRGQDDPEGRALPPLGDFAFGPKNRSYARKTGSYTTLPD